MSECWYVHTDRQMLRLIQTHTLSRRAPFHHTLQEFSGLALGCFHLKTVDLAFWKMIIPLGRTEDSLHPTPSP